MNAPVSVAFPAPTDESDSLEQIELVLRQMGLSKNSSTFLDILQRKGEYDSLAMVPSDRLGDLLNNLVWYRDRQSPEVLEGLRIATTLAQKVYPPGRNVWSVPSLAEWRDQHRPLSVTDLEALIQSLARILQDAHAA